MTPRVTLLADDPTVIEPDVLATDQRRWETWDSKLVDRAHRRREVGWVVGHHINVMADYRHIPAWSGRVEADAWSAGGKCRSEAWMIGVLAVGSKSYVSLNGDIPVHPKKGLRLRDNGACGPRPAAPSLAGSPQTLARALGTL